MKRDLQVENVEVSREGGNLRLRLTGEWTLYTPRPSFQEVVDRGDLASAERVRVDGAGIAAWDSHLLVFLIAAREACRRQGCRFEPVGLPEGLSRLLDQVPIEAQSEPEADEKLRPSFFANVGERARTASGRAADIFRFTGDLCVAAVHQAFRPHRFRWGDCLEAMQQTGAQALPIVGLISFLVGMIMAFQAAIQLRQFGADIFVADLVGLAVVREMGPMMAAIVLAGRTGAAFAAEIGTMKVNEEIDALQTLGAAPVEFLVLPRMLALFLMMPLLAIYADFLGILGGMAVAASVMDITPASYWAETREAIVLPDLLTGLVKAVAFGLLIAFAGCLRGLQCTRSSAGVGAAATSAVVTSILLIIVADAVFAVTFNRLGF